MDVPQCLEPSIVAMDRQKINRRMKRILRFNIDTKYCRKFCSTGFCPNKSNCRFVHDQTKIAVCPRFLYNKCESPRCLLSHVKTPDRMPDCLFFLKGCCKVVACPFRHVKVNKNANLCREFLKGLCFKGLKCQQRHQFECGSFKHTGKCRKGNKCNFAHQKSNALALSAKKTNRKSSHFSKINNNNSSNNISSDQKNNVEKTTNNYKMPSKSILNELLAKRLLSPTKIMVKPNMDMIGMESPSFIKLSTDDGIVAEMPSVSKNGSANKILMKDLNEMINDARGRRGDLIANNEETEKYFLIDNGDSDLISFNNGSNVAAAIKSAQNLCRPPLKIIPDFLMNPT